MLRDETSGLRAGVQPSGKSVRVSSSSVDLRRACPIDEKNDGPGALQAEARGDGELLLDETQPGSKMRGPLPRNIRVVRGKPTAAATIEPIGPAVRSARSYAIRLTLKFDDVDEKFADRGWMVGSAERVLAGFAPSTGAEAPTVGDVVGLAERNVVGIEDCVVGEGRPIWCNGAVHLSFAAFALAATA